MESTNQLNQVEMEVLENAVCRAILNCISDRRVLKQKLTEENLRALFNKMLDNPLNDFTK